MPWNKSKEWKQEIETKNNDHIKSINHINIYKNNKKKPKLNYI